MSKVRRAFHHQIWQRLPRSLRRSVLFASTRLTAPRLSLTAQPAKPIIVAGALRTASGLGQSARLCFEALRMGGIPALGIDLTAGLMQPQDAPDFAFADGSMIEGEGTLVVHVNAPLMGLALSQLGRKRLKGRYVVGYWAWELPRVPDEWKYGLPFVHEIWVPSQFTAEAILPLAGPRPVKVIPHPVGVWQLIQGPGREQSPRPYTVLTIFNMTSSFARKNPLAAIDAFFLAFGNDPKARLVIKASNLSAFPEGLKALKSRVASRPNIILIERVMSTIEVNDLYTMSDVVVSLHRSEGFGLTIAEAMLHGLPVIATDWSGNVDFLTASTGWPIPYQLVTAQDPQGTYDHNDMMWADPNIEAAAQAMRSLRSDPSKARRLGQAAREYANLAWGGQRYTDLVIRSLGLQ